MNTTRKTIARIVATAAGASALLIAGAAQAALQDRDLDGDSVVDAFYDTDLDITWLRNADVNGGMDWYTASAWVDGFSFAGYDDWRLPTTLQPDPTCDGHWNGNDLGYNCTGGEMGHLWYLELGNTAHGPMTNTGNFQNLHSYYYWSDTKFMDDDPDWDYRFVFEMGGGSSSGMGIPGSSLYAMAVRAGDVPVVPEPATYALMLAGLVALALVRRRRSR